MTFYGVTLTWWPNDTANRECYFRCVGMPKTVRLRHAHVVDVIEARVVGRWQP